MTSGLLLAFGGLLLLIGAINNEHPWTPVVNAFGGTPPPAPGSAALASATDTSVGGNTAPAPGTMPSSGGVTPAAGGDCSVPVNLVTWQGVTLTAPAMAAFQRAQAAANGRIGVVSSYRSCAQQVATCLAHNCTPPDCCPGTVAGVGRSKHQRGEALDVSNWLLALPYLTVQGWCHPLPLSDAGHFSFNGCG